MYDKLNELDLREGEPASSFFARLAAHYGLASAREFAGDFGLSFDGIASGRPEHLARLAELTGCDLESLLANTPITGDPIGWLQIRGEMIAHTFSRRKNLYVCPECWTEDITSAPYELPEAAAYMRLHWLFSPITTCERHSRRLVLVKSAHNNRVLYDTALLAGDLALNLPAMLEEKIERSASAFEVYVRGRIYGRNVSAGILDKLGLSEVFSICAHIGRAVALQPDRLNEMTEDELHRAYELGFLTLSGGREALRDSFWEMLEHQAHRLPATIGPQNLIGRAYPVLIADHVGERRYAPLYADIANAIYDVMTWGPDQTPLFGVPITHRRFYSAMGAGRAFGFAPRTMDNYAVAAGIARVFGSNKGRRRILIDTVAAHELFDTAGHVAEKNLSRYGMTLVQRKAIMNAGQLKTVLPRHLFPDNEKPPIRVTDVENLMARFLSSAQPLAKVPKGCATLGHTARVIAGRLADVHQLILDGTVWTGRLQNERRPYASIVVRTEEVRAALGATGLLNTREMSAASGIPKELLIAMCSASTIEHRVDLNLESGKVRRSFKPETAVWARRELIPLTRLARRSGRQAKTFQKRLDDLGIRPFCTVAIARGGMSVYRVQDVANLKF